MRIASRFLLLVSLVGLLARTAPLAAETNRPAAQSFKVTIHSKLDVDAEGQKQKLEADTQLQYTWRRNGAERELTLDALSVRVTNNGTPMVDTLMNKDKFVSSAPGKPNEIPFDQAPAALKSVLNDGFRAPLFRYQFDAQGNRVEQKVLAGPGAQMVVNNGMIANALIFHPFFPGQDQWQSDAEFSMGNGGYAKGRLNYKKTSPDKYEVSGTLSNPGYTQADTSVTVKDASYVVTGEELYDPAQQEWAAGKLAMDVSFKMFLDEKSIGTTAGKMNVTFQRLPPVR